MARYTVDPDALWARTKDPDTVPMEVLEQLAEFGEVMIGEVQARNETIENKALNMIGWTSAAMAVLLAAPPTVESGWLAKGMVGLVLGGAVAAVTALLYSARALRMRSWHWPSQQEWFCDELLGDARKLRRYHLGVWLRTHEEHSRCTGEKAGALKKAQAAFILMGIALGATMFMSALLQWKVWLP